MALLEEIPMANERKVDRKYAVDEQTGEIYELRSEGAVDHAVAWICIVYMLVFMGFFFWMLIDLYFGKYTLAFLLRLPYVDPDKLNNPAFRLPAYAFIGGAL